MTSKDRLIATVTRDLNAEVVARIMGEDVTRRDLIRAFERVEDRTNWKNPINCEVRIEDDRDMETIRAAVEFLTGSKATFEFVRANVYRCKAVGYYAAVGA